MHAETSSAPTGEAEQVLVKLGIEIPFLVEPALRNPLVRVWKVGLVMVELRDGHSDWCSRRDDPFFARRAVDEMQRFLRHSSQSAGDAIGQAEGFFDNSIQVR